jgi:2-polyprenyl-3-methyl-5-hydroxy-6-metoxy-1,4-benzoquinol methylase
VVRLSKKDMVGLENVKSFWEQNPLSTAAINCNPGSPEFYQTYDSLRERNEPPDFARILHEYDHFSGKRVLEVGCGNGYTLGKYAQAGAEVYGIDVTETAVDISRKRFEYQKMKGDFIVGNAEDLPYESNFFDCVCSMGVLHHVPDTEQAVAEIHRCLKPGGRLIVMVYHRDSIPYRFVMPLHSLLTGKSLQQLVNEVDGVGNPKGDVYSKEELKRLLVQFRDLEIFCGLLQPQKLRSLLPTSIGERLGTKWGWFLYAKGYK